MVFSVALALLLSQTSAGFVIQSPEYRRSALKPDIANALSIPEGAPSYASPTIISNFLGFAFEETSFPQYAGAPGSPNTLSVNLLNNIASRTNSRPFIRVGGTSLDQAKYDPNQSAAVSFPPNQPGNVPSKVTIGPSYFQSFANFPSALYTLCIPLAANNLTNSVKFVTDGYPVIKSQLEFLEIGNEPQSYPGSVRPASYSPLAYVSQWLQYSNAISAAIGLSNTPGIYQAVALGSPGVYENEDRAANPGPWYPVALFQQGFGQVASRFGSVSMHWYQTRANYNVPGATQLQQELMNHTIMVEKMSFYKSAISYFAQNYNLGVALDESASSLNGPTNAYSLETTFGAALWQVDWLLWSMYIGIRRIGWQQISASAFDLWQPTSYKGRSPAVLPAYYAMLFAADFIGNRGDTQVTNLDLSSDVFVAYAAYATSASYSGKRLARVAIINLNFWVGPPTRTNVRPSQTFALQFPAGVNSVQVKYLTSLQGATASDGSQVTWEGQTYTPASNGLAQQSVQNTATVQVTNGIAFITVKSSQAVMVVPNYTF